MTASVLVTIFCDWPNCGRWDEDGVGDTAALARKQLQGRNWRLNVRNESHRRRLDFCPEHATGA